jgi:peptidoglycan/xylan/chitin deacetylase (PgdA/CDA1 family)
MGNRVLVVAYHNVVPDDAPPRGDLANHLPLSSFLTQVCELARTHDVVPIQDTLAPPPRDSRRPRAAITFDDAYQGAAVHAIPELVRLGLPATIFVAPAFIGGKSFWWDAIAGANGEGLAPTVRDYALGELRGEDGAVRQWAIEAGLPLTAMPPVACAATEEELARAASLPGITVGAHTWSHPNLSRLNPAKLEVELVEPLDWIRARFANPIPWIAYPYGAFDSDVARAAAAAGYDGGLGVSGGWFPAANPDRLALPRVNIPRGLSPSGFALRGSGLFCD